MTRLNIILDFRSEIFTRAAKRMPLCFLITQFSCEQTKRTGMAEIYTTCCRLCKKQFKTRKALEKHYSQKHPGHDIPQNVVFSSATKQAPILRPRRVKKRNLYLEWLAEVVECINSAHNPRVPGKYLNTNGGIEMPKFSFLILITGRNRTFPFTLAKGSTRS